MIPLNKLEEFEERALRGDAVAARVVVHAFRAYRRAAEPRVVAWPDGSTQAWAPADRAQLARIRENPEAVEIPT